MGAYPKGSPRLSPDLLTELMADLSELPAIPALAAMTDTDPVQARRWVKTTAMGGAALAALIDGAETHMAEREAAHQRVRERLSAIRDDLAAWNAANPDKAIEVKPAKNTAAAASDEASG